MAANAIVSAIAIPTLPTCLAVIMPSVVLSYTGVGFLPMAQIQPRRGFAWTSTSE
jgi:hypothetical protein